MHYLMKDSSGLGSPRAGDTSTTDNTNNFSTRRNSQSLKSSEVVIASCNSDITKTFTYPEEEKVDEDVVDNGNNDFKREVNRLSVSVDGIRMMFQNKRLSWNEQKENMRRARAQEMCRLYELNDNKETKLNKHIIFNDNKSLHHHQQQKNNVTTRASSVKSPPSFKPSTKVYAKKQQKEEVFCPLLTTNHDCSSSSAVAELQQCILREQAKEQQQHPNNESSKLCIEIMPSMTTTTPTKKKIDRVTVPFVPLLTPTMVKEEKKSLIKIDKDGHELGIPFRAANGRIYYVRNMC